jgi:hypothetical protein
MDKPLHTSSAAQMAVTKRFFRTIPRSPEILKNDHSTDVESDRHDFS